MGVCPLHSSANAKILFIAPPPPSFGALPLLPSLFPWLLLPETISVLKNGIRKCIRDFRLRRNYTRRMKREASALSAAVRSLSLFAAKETTGVSGTGELQEAKGRARKEEAT